MLNRRYFNKISATTLLASLLGPKLESEEQDNVVVATWNNSEAVAIAKSMLDTNPDALLDAIEIGVNSVENNPDDTSVGYGGFPDNSGRASLDACIMDEKGNAGSVCYLREIKNAVSVARKVMELTPHVMMAGDGAQEFALNNGFTKNDLSTDKSIKAYEKWLEKAIYNPKVNSERHDTIGLIARNSKANLSGACSTSGLAFKMPGRVGDSPIIGSGLFVDNEYGAATATGYGELIMQSCSAFLVVELMRQGRHPETACMEAIKRIAKTYNVENRQVGLIALDKSGRVGAYALRKGFNYAVAGSNGLSVLESSYLI